MKVIICADDSVDISAIITMFNLDHQEILPLQEEKNFTVGDLSLNIENRILTDLISNKFVSLKPQEVALMYFLMQYQGRFIPKHIILEKLWPNVCVDDHTINVHICSLRKYLRSFGRDNIIRTLYCVGFGFFIG